MGSKTLLDEVTAALKRYRRVLSPGTYVFSPELERGRMTGRVVESRAGFPENYAVGAESPVNFGFYPLGPLPRSLQGAPPSWLSGYPFLPDVEKLSEAPDVFLEQLKEHVEARLGAVEPADEQPAGEWPFPLEEAP